MFKEIFKKPMENYPSNECLLEIHTHENFTESFFALRCVDFFLYRFNAFASAFY